MVNWTFDILLIQAGVLDAGWSNAAMPATMWAVWSNFQLNIECWRLFSPPTLTSMMIRPSFEPSASMSMNTRGSPDIFGDFFDSCTADDVKLATRWLKSCVLVENTSLTAVGRLLASEPKQERPDAPVAGLAVAMARAALRSNMAISKGKLVEELKTLADLNVYELPDGDRM